MVVNVEIKNAPQDPGWDAGEAVAALTAAAIEEAGWADRVIVSSFQVTTLRAVQAADGRLALGALWGFGAEPGPALAEAAAAGFRAVHPFVTSVTPELVERAHAAGLGRQRVDGQRAGRPAGDGRAGGGHRDHRPAPRRPRRGGRPRRSEARKRACHRAEWRYTAPVHKDGRP